MKSENIIVTCKHFPSVLSMVQSSHFAIQGKNFKDISYLLPCIASQVKRLLHRTLIVYCDTHHRNSRFVDWNRYLTSDMYAFVFFHVLQLCLPNKTSHDPAVDV